MTKFTSILIHILANPNTKSREVFLKILLGFRAIVLSLKDSSCLRLGVDSRALCHIKGYANTKNIKKSIKNTRVLRTLLNF